MNHFLNKRPENSAPERLPAAGSDPVLATRPGSRSFIRKARKALAAAALLAAVFVLSWQIGLAKDSTGPQPAGSPIHPRFPLLDSQGQNVIASGEPVSTYATCGTCHDTDFIRSHSFHADAGLSDFGAAGEVDGGKAWDSSPGPFGRWDPLTYRYLSPAGDAIIDLTTADWVAWFTRHPGGGPAETSRQGEPLASLAQDPTNVETATFNPQTGQMAGWDWSASGTVEMNCFLCHTPNPDNQARIAALSDGDFGGAATATLSGTGLVARGAQGWEWQAGAFDTDGVPVSGAMTVQDPTDENCGQCHGLVHSQVAVPLSLEAYGLGDYTSLTTGQILSPQRLSDSGLNLAGKDDLTRSWDVHAERVVGCTDCHYALNNPVYYQEDPEKQPDHLLFDPRRLDFGEYLYRPSHDFAKGDSAQTLQAASLDNSQRTCESCHSIATGHDWLPYQEQHSAALACEACHIPKIYGPAVEQVNWTVLDEQANPLVTYRGLDGEDIGAQAFLSGFEPALLPDAQGRLSPANLITFYYWTYGDPARPVPLRLLASAWLDGPGYDGEILAAFDLNGDGQLSTAELGLGDPAQVDLIAARLADLGLADARIAAETRAYGIHHDVAAGEWARRECQECHSHDSRLSQAISLSPASPGGVLPAFTSPVGAGWPGSLETGAHGELAFIPDPGESGLYILGLDAVGLIDRFGAALFIAVLAGVGLHGGLRVWSARRQIEPGAHPAVREVYMYDFYERLWHWLQTGAILLLLFTGLVIHRPDSFGMFRFRYVVQVHNILAAILVINAGLSLFYHLVSGEIRQYLPRPRGFFNQAIEQSLYYLRGIFRREPHPFEKTRQRKLNPLQQVTYFAILNVLLPLQIISGALMWGAQRWPELAASLGGLPFLAPFHTLIAWSFGSFIVMHVYLTTTGHTPLANIKAMMLGWDELEFPDSPLQPESAD